ncbi:MAG: HAD family hydrolase, partial [Clostridia bacterium]|nr:HAD family hydrolase [Clostridia bacterium]
KEMIEGTEIYKQGAFQKVYASAFYYDENGNAIWPAQVVNFTNKTQYLFRISKGTVEINDPGVNEVFAKEEIRVPFTNMIYVGDSATDIPCMKLVCSYGGLSIGVYNENTGDKRAVEKILCENRINHACSANYSKDSELEKIVFNVIDKVAKTI